jgi:topoisomerase IA-like protein
METLKPYIGSYMDSPLFLNHGQFGYFLHHNKKLYSVPKCFQKPDFKLKDAIKIIEYREKWLKENRKDDDDKKDDDIIKRLDKEPKVLQVTPAKACGLSEDKDVKVKSKKNILD